MPHTTRGTLAESPVTRVPVNAFRAVILIAVAAGTLGGLVWFGLEYFTVLPLIEAAEKYEAAAHGHEDHEDHGSRLSRNSLTAVTTVLSAIGFAAVLFGVVLLTGRKLDAKSGALWGLAAFVCMSIAPALGLPPQPPGSAVGDLASRQLWWVGTVVATGAGLFLIVGAAADRGFRRTLRIAAGLVCLVAPHVIGAPAPVGESLVPASLVRQFEVASLATAGAFWITLGTIGGHMAKDLAQN
jgi:cobalt transporter subunit CbtA